MNTLCLNCYRLPKQSFCSPNCKRRNNWKIIAANLMIPEFNDPAYLRYEDEYYTLINTGYNKNEAMVEACKRINFN